MVLEVQAQVTASLAVLQAAHTQAQVLLLAELPSQTSVTTVAIRSQALRLNAVAAVVAVQVAQVATVPRALAVQAAAVLHRASPTQQFLVLAVVAAAAAQLAVPQQTAEVLAVVPVPEVMALPTQVVAVAVQAAQLLMAATAVQVWSL